MDGLFQRIRTAADQLTGTDWEKKVKAATSPENWGASSTLKNEIANGTFSYQGYREIMPCLWERMRCDAKDWRIIFKALELLEHLLRLGAERVAEEARGSMFQLRILKDFRFTDEHVDRGSGIREKTKQLIELLTDKEQMREEREKAAKSRQKFVAISSESVGAPPMVSGRYDHYDSDSYAQREAYDAHSSRSPEKPRRRHGSHRREADSGDSGDSRSDDEDDHKRHGRRNGGRRTHRSREPSGDDQSDEEPRSSRRHGGSERKKSERAAQSPEAPAPAVPAPAAPAAPAAVAPAAAAPAPAAAAKPSTSVNLFELFTTPQSTQSILDMPPAQPPRAPGQPVPVAKPTEWDPFTGGAPPARPAAPAASEPIDFSGFQSAPSDKKKPQQQQSAVAAKPKSVSKPADLCWDSSLVDLGGNKPAHSHPVGGTGATPTLAAMRTRSPQKPAGASSQPQPQQPFGGMFSATQQPAQPLPNMYSMPPMQQPNMYQQQPFPQQHSFHPQQFQPAPPPQPYQQQRNPGDVFFS